MGKNDLFEQANPAKALAALALMMIASRIPCSGLSLT